MDLTSVEWRKSRASGNNGGNCVEVATNLPHLVAVRDSNLRRLTDYPNLWGYARDLYQRPEFRETTDFGAIKTAYYGGFARLNPARIIPAGPEIDWAEPHGRERRPA